MSNVTDIKSVYPLKDPACLIFRFCIRNSVHCLNKDSSIFLKWLPWYRNKSCDFMQLFVLFLQRIIHLLLQSNYRVLTKTNRTRHSSSCHVVSAHTEDFVWGTVTLIFCCFYLGWKINIKPRIKILMDKVLKKTYAKPKITTAQFSRQHVSIDSAGTFVTLNHALFNKVWLVLGTLKTTHGRRRFKRLWTEIASKDPFFFFGREVPASWIVISSDATCFQLDIRRSCSEGP